MQVSGSVTINSGTPIQLAAKTPPTLFTRLLIQCQPAAGAGLIYVFNGVPYGTTPSTSTFPFVTLAAAGASAPSDDYEDRLDTGDSFAIDLGQIWIDGAHTGDVVTFTGDRKI